MKAKVLAHDDKEKLDKLGGPDQEVKMWLTNEDMTFKETRDANFSSLEEIFSRKLIEIQKIVQEKNAPQTIEALQDYIKKVKNLKIPKEKDRLSNHINVASHMSAIIRSFDYTQALQLEQRIIVGEPVNLILETLELMLGKGYERNTIIRLYCLLSLRENGLKQKSFDFLRREYIQSFGFTEVLTLLNLETASLFKKGAEKHNWALVKKSFTLIYEDVNLKKPNDIAYVYNGYAPLSVRCVELLVSKGWGQCYEILKLIPGEVEISQYEKELLKKPREDNRKKVVVVFFIGGVTYAEISAIRYLNIVYPNFQFVVATTEIINGNSIIEQMREKVQNLLNKGTIPIKKK